MCFKKLLSCVLCLFMLTACAEVQLASHVAKKIPPSSGNFKVGNPYQVYGKTYRPRETYKDVETGMASWYGPNFHGKRTANGETFDKNALTAAHKTLQMPSIIRVTNLQNGRSAVLRVNDRGPFSKRRVLDVSERAADMLGFKNQGTTKVKIEVLEQESRHVAALAKQGIDTSGIEIAMNNGTWKGIQPREPITQLAMNDTLAAPAAAPVQKVASTSLKPIPTHATPPAPAAQHNAAPLGNNIHLASAPAMPPPLRPEAIAPSAGRGIFVQAGAFRDRANAMRMADSLQTYGRANLHPTLVNGQQWYRVRLGPFPSEAAAHSLTARLGDGGAAGAIVVID